MTYRLLDARLFIPRGDDHRAFDLAFDGWRGERRQRRQSPHPSNVPERGESPNEEQRCCAAKDKSAQIAFNAENVTGLSVISKAPR